MAAAASTAGTGGQELRAKLPLLRIGGFRSASIQMRYGSGPKTATVPAVASAATASAASSARRRYKSIHTSTGIRTGFGTAASTIPSGIPATARSRCQAITATAPTSATVTLPSRRSCTIGANAITDTATRTRPVVDSPRVAMAEPATRTASFATSHATTATPVGRTRSGTVIAAAKGE